MFAIRGSSKTTERTESKNRMLCLRSCAMAPASLSSKTQTHTARMTTQLHLSSQTKKVTTCFVLNDYSDDSETLAAGENVPLPTKSTGQTFLTPQLLPLPLLSTSARPIPKSGTYRMLYGVFFRDYPRHVIVQGRERASKHA